MEAESRDLLARLGLHVDVHAPVGRLTIGERQLVELARVLLEEPQLIILDEPNSALNERETQRLFAVLRQLRTRGHTMLYVSHRLEEVFAISDRVTITRNGRDVLTKDRADLTIPEVIVGMIGVQHDQMFPPPLPPTAGRADDRIVVKGLSGGPLKNVDLTARAGEVIGLAGLEGSGASALLAILFGTQKASAGEVTFPDARGLPRSPTDAARRGVCLVPADRRRNGLMLEKSILFNISQVFVGAQTGGSWLFRNGPAYARAQRQIDNLKIKARSPWTLANQLSGGNQQKVVIGKWLEIGPKVFLLDDPTRGVDVGAKREIYGADPEDVGRRRHRPVLLDRAARAGRPLRPHRRLLPGPHRRGALRRRRPHPPPRHQYRRDAGRIEPNRDHAMTDTAAPPTMTRRRFRLPEETGVIIALVLMIVIIGIARPRFLNPINLLTILGHTTFQGMLAIGMVYLLAIREIDLSVGWIFNFSAVFSGLLMVAGIDPWIAAFAGVAFGAGARPLQRPARRRPPAAGDHRHPRHLFDVPGPVAGGQ